MNTRPRRKVATGEARKSYLFKTRQINYPKKSKSNKKKTKPSPLSKLTPDDIDQAIAEIDLFPYNSSYLPMSDEDFQKFMMELDVMFENIKE